MQVKGLTVLVGTVGVLAITAFHQVASAASPAQVFAMQAAQPAWITAWCNRAGTRPWFCPRPPPTPTPPPPAPVAEKVVLNWVSPAANATLTGTAQFRLTGQAFQNVEIFSNGQMIARAAIAADRKSASASIDTKRFANGAIELSARAWNSPAGSAFTSEASAGSRSFIIDNTSPAPTPVPAAFWPSGTDGLDRKYHNDFGAWRGRPSTSAWINVHWVTWEWLTAPGLFSTLNNRDPVKVWDMYANFPGIAVMSMSMAGNSNVSREEYDTNMRQCASGAYNAYWEQFAANASAAGRDYNNTVVSLAHEFNGTWFKWHPGTVGLTVWKQCWRNVYFSIKKRSTIRVAWVFSASNVRVKGGDWSVNNVWEAYPGDDAVDVIGVNRYDFRDLGPISKNWRDTCGNDQDICYAAKFAREHGKPLGVPEWGSDRQKGYPDNAEFVDKMYGFFKDNADILLFENSFNFIVPGTPGYWHFYPQSEINAKASARYKELWRVR